MQQRLSVITLGVSSLEQTSNFYENGLGWKKENLGPKEILYFKTGGMLLAFYNRSDLAKITNGRNFSKESSGIILSHNVSDPAHVDIVIQEARLAGGNLLKLPQSTNWGGYSGFFADLDGYPWEVVWNPKWEIQSDGGILFSD